MSPRRIPVAWVPHEDRPDAWWAWHRGYHLDVWSETSGRMTWWAWTVTDRADVEVKRGTGSPSADAARRAAARHATLLRGGMVPAERRRAWLACPVIQDPAAAARVGFAAARQCAVFWPPTGIPAARDAHGRTWADRARKARSWMQLAAALPVEHPMRALALAVSRGAWPDGRRYRPETLGAGQDVRNGTK